MNEKLFKVCKINKQSYIYRHLGSWCKHNLRMCRMCMESCSHSGLPVLSRCIPDSVLKIIKIFWLAVISVGIYKKNASNISISLIDGLLYSFRRQHIQTETTYKQTLFCIVCVGWVRLVHIWYLILISDCWRTVVSYWGDLQKKCWITYR